MELKVTATETSLIAPGNTTVGTKGVGYEDVFSSGFVTVEVRYHDPVFSLMALERPPTSNVMSATDRQTTYDIPVPWQVYIVDYNTGTVRTYFRKEPLTGMDDELFLCYLDHVKPDGSTCSDSYHRRNKRDLVGGEGEIKPFDLCAALINDAVWSGGIHGASYMEWYAGVPRAIKQHKRNGRSTTQVLDEKFSVARVMNEVDLLSYGDTFTGIRSAEHRWSSWFGEPLTLEKAIRKSRESGTGSSLKRYFETHV